MFQPLVTESLCPAKKARIGGCRKKRSVQTVFGSVDVAVAVQPGAILEDDVQPGAVLDQVLSCTVLEDMQTEAILDQVQTEAVLDQVQTEAVLDHVQTEAVLDHVQTEAALDQVVQPEIPPLSRAVVRPSEGDAKKTRSMNDLLGIEAKASKSKPKPKKKKSNAKKK